MQTVTLGDTKIKVASPYLTFVYNAEKLMQADATKRRTTIDANITDIMNQKNLTKNKAAQRLFDDLVILKELKMLSKTIVSWIMSASPIIWHGAKQIWNETATSNGIFWHAMGCMVLFIICACIHFKVFGFTNCKFKIE